jgi:hypothetical protein
MLADTAQIFAQYRLLQYIVAVASSLAHTSDAGCLDLCSNSDDNIAVLLLVMQNSALSAEGLTPPPDPSYETMNPAMNSSGSANSDPSPDSVRFLQPRSEQGDRQAQGHSIARLYPKFHSVGCLQTRHEQGD